MVNHDKAYTFLLTRRTATGISIRRIEIVKVHLHAGALGFLAMFGLFLLGAAGSLESHVVAEAEIPVEQPAQVSVVQSVAQQPVDVAVGTSEEPIQFPVAPENASADSGPVAAQVFSDPRTRKLVQPTADSQPFTVRTGGPSFRNSNEDPLEDLPESGLEARVRQIKILADPAFLPVEWAVRGKVNNEFGFRRNPFGGRSYEFHGGMDIDGDHGDDVFAPANGVVIKAGWMGGYGNVIEVDHGYGLTTRYGHLSRISVKVGDVITRGDLIGLIGSTGRSTGPHLHFEVRINEKAINPRLFLSARSAFQAD